MAQGETTFGMGLTCGAAGLGLAALAVALLPIDPLAASQRRRAEAGVSALVQPTFSLRCSSTAPQPGFQLMAPAATGSAAGECELHRERL